MPDVAWLGAGIAETVTSDFTALDHFRVVDRWRVVQAARAGRLDSRRRRGASASKLVVTGSYQRSGPSLRITARVVDLASGDAVADAKVDGRLDDVFALQDGIVVDVRARSWACPAPASDAARRARDIEPRRVSRLTEGWMKIESLDTTSSAPRRGLRARDRVDPRFAMAYTGLANAEFVAYEMTRVSAAPGRTRRSRPESSTPATPSRSTISWPRRTRTLSFLLVSAHQFDEARAAAQRAVTLEPGSWRHQYRLGHALWGAARLRALARALALYPQFSYAQFETAMVHVARGELTSPSNSRGLAWASRTVRRSRAIASLLSDSTGCSVRSKCRADASVRQSNSSNASWRSSIDDGCMDPSTAR